MNCQRLFSDHTTLLPIFTGWGVPAALDTAQHSFPEKIEKGWHTAMLPLSLSFSVEKLEEKLGRKKKLASTTVQITKLCHCLGGWNSPSRQRGAPRTGHQFIRGLTYGAQTHTYWHSDSPINPTCVSLDCRRRPCSEQSPGSFSSEAAGLTAAPAALPLW